MLTNIFILIFRAVIFLSQKDFYQHWTKPEHQLFPEMRSDVIYQVYLLQQTPRKSNPITPDQCPADFPWAYNEVRVVSTKSSLRFYLQREEKLLKQRNLCVNGSDLKIWDCFIFRFRPFRSENLVRKGKDCCSAGTSMAQQDLLTSGAGRTSKRTNSIENANFGQFSERYLSDSQKNTCQILRKEATVW